MDLLVVRTSELAAVIKPFIDKHNSRFPKYMGTASEGFKKDASVSYSYSAYQYIMLNCRVKMSERVLWRIIVQESKHTELYLADAILCAIDEPGALRDGRIEILHNPRLRRY